MTNEEEADFSTFVIRHSTFVIAPRSPHVHRWRRPSRHRAIALDRLHSDADLREEQYAVVRPAIVARRDQSVSRSRPTQRTARRVRPRELSDQSRGHESAIPREFSPRALRGAG